MIEAGLLRDRPLRVLGLHLPNKPSSGCDLAAVRTDLHPGWSQRKGSTRQLSKPATDACRLYGTIGPALQEKHARPDQIPETVCSHYAPPGSSSRTSSTIKSTPLGVTLPLLHGARQLWAVDARLWAGDLHYQRTSEGTTWHRGLGDVKNWLPPTLTTPDATLIFLDARMQRPLGSSSSPDPNLGYFATRAPLLFSRST